MGMIHEAGREMGFDPSQWKVTFDFEGGDGARVEDDDPIKAHIRVYPLKKEATWNEAFFRFMALHEVGHIKGRHLHKFFRYRILGMCLVALASVGISVFDKTPLLSVRLVFLTCSLAPSPLPLFAPPPPGLPLAATLKKLNT